MARQGRCFAALFSFAKRTTIMSFCYAKEKRKFDAEWQRLEAAYRAAGMSEQSIRQMYQFDLSDFNSRRRYESKAVYIVGEMTVIADGKPRTLALHRFPQMVSTFDEDSLQGRYAWVDAIDGELADVIKQLLPNDLELITCKAFDGYTQAELAVKFNTSQAGICRKLKKIKKKLKK